MKLKFIVGMLVIAAMPVCTLAQGAPPKATKADAQKVVKMISSDKAKTQTYCDIAKLGDQIGEADAKKDTKKVDELSKQMDDMSTKLGPEYIALMDSLQDVDPTSKDGKDIGAVLDSLDKLCAK
jgi:ABC-type transporter Mla subunit MlaD